MKADVNETKKAARPAAVEQNSELGSIQIHDNVLSSLVRRAA